MSKRKREVPKFESPIVETHCHLDYLKQDSLEDIISKSRSQGIEKILTISVEPGNLDTALNLAQKNENV